MKNPKPAGTPQMPKAGDRVRCIKKGIWTPAVGIEGTIDEVSLNFHSNHPKGSPEAYGEVAVKWDHDRKGYWTNFPWAEYMEILGQKEPAPKSAPKAKPERPTDLLPGDRVRLLVNDGLDKGSVGTVIGVFSEEAAVDWSPWNHGHDMMNTFPRMGYPKGTHLPGDTGWTVARKMLKLIQRGNIVYED